MRSVPDFVQLLKERKFPIEDMRMSVVEKHDDQEILWGIVTLVDEGHFTLEWKFRDCLLSCIAHLKVGRALHCLPYCLGLKSHGIMNMDCDHAKRLQVICTIR